MLATTELGNLGTGGISIDGTDADSDGPVGGGRDNPEAYD